MNMKKLQLAVKMIAATGIVSILVVGFLLPWIALAVLIAKLIAVAPV